MWQIFFIQRYIYIFYLFQFCICRMSWSWYRFIIRHVSGVLTNSSLIFTVLYLWFDLYKLLRKMYLHYVYQTVSNCARLQCVAEQRQNNSCIWKMTIPVDVKLWEGVMTGCARSAWVEMTHQGKWFRNDSVPSALPPTLWLSHIQQLQNVEKKITTFTLFRFYLCLRAT